MTVAVHLVVLLFLLFYTLSAPVIRENDGSGILLQWGVLDAGEGTFTPEKARPVPPVKEHPEELVTQDVEETVSLPEEPTPTLQPEVPEKPVEVEPKPETTQADNLWAKAVNRQENADTLAMAGERKGSPRGNANQGALAGSPGYGDYDLGGRGLVGRLPKPEYAGTNDEGTVVVEVLVDAQGQVIQANVTPSGSKGTAAGNATLRSRSEAAARKAVFERKSSGNENQWGTITYYFKQN
ncbi:MAG: TonB family protein [Porphyromonadaceae bacterium]|nr:TonB family protein [Porphyromonadaceae bacterium]